MSVLNKLLVEPLDILDLTDFNLKFFLTFKEYHKKSYKHLIPTQFLGYEQ